MGSEMCIRDSRWGGLVFHTTDIDEAWDGTSNEVRLQQGTYLYHITGQFVSGETFTKSGVVHLLD